MIIEDQFLTKSKKNKSSYILKNRIAELASRKLSHEHITH